MQEDVKFENSEKTSLISVTQLTSYIMVLSLNYSDKKKSFIVYSFLHTSSKNHPISYINQRASFISNLIDLRKE